MFAEKKRKRPHEWLEEVLGVLGLAPSTHIYEINQKVIKGYNKKTGQKLFSIMFCHF